jgi:hypothetical protein
VCFCSGNASEDNEVLNQSLQTQEIFQSILRLAKGMGYHGANVYIARKIAVSVLHDLKPSTVMEGKTFSIFFLQIPHIKKKAQIQDTSTLLRIHPLCVGSDYSVWNLLVCRRHEVY